MGSTKNSKSSSVYKLVCVGSPFRDVSSGVYVIPCYFQPWLRTRNIPADLPISIRIVNSNIAGELICGSFWTDIAELDKSAYGGSSDFEVFWTGCKPLYAVLLKDIIDPAVLIPSPFWAKNDSTWVVCMECNKKKILIPYFELLRVLLYHASRRLTQFFFSYFSLNHLCRPLSTPDNKTNQLARFYVASEELSELEATVLGGLLFDPALKQLFDLSQNHWLNSRIVTNPRKLVVSFNKNILLDASGYSFTNNGEQYFWTESLKIINSPYNFRNLVFHPLERKHLTISDCDGQFICSDLLNDNIEYSRLLKLRCLSQNTNHKHKLSTSRTKRSKKYWPSINSILPSVTCSLPWANTPLTKATSYWLDRTMAARVERKNEYKTSVKHTPVFKKILSKFMATGYAVEFLSLNNPRSIFGAHVSVLPVDNHTALPLTLYRKSIKIFTIAKISLNYGPIFLIQPFPEQNPELVLLCQKQDLNSPTDLEWNNLLKLVQPIFTYSDYAKFYSKSSSMNKNNISTNSAFIALAIPLGQVTIDLCILLNDHLIAKFRKRLQFYLASYLRYPDGISYDQRKELIRVSRNICKTPNSMWILSIANYWTHATR